MKIKEIFFFRKLSHVLACTSCKSLEFQPLLRKTVNGDSVRFSNSTLQSKMAITSNLSVENFDVDSTTENCFNSFNLNQKSSCLYCGIGPIHLAGPIYTDPLHDIEFVNRLLTRIKETPENERLGTHERLTGLLTVVSEVF